MTEIDDLLEGWENGNDVQFFRQWLVLVCGVEENSDTYKYLKDVIIDNDSLSKFIEVFDGNLDHIEQATHRYMEAYGNEYGAISV